MKNLTYFFLIMTTGFIACKKTEVKSTALASINVTNVVPGGTSLTLNSSTLTVANNAAAPFGLIAGQSQVKLFPAATPNAPYYNKVISTVNGDYYSLFLTGTPTAVETVLIRESYKNYADSLCGIRFINLSPNSSPISVNLSGSANGSEVTSLAYKAYSSFKQYQAKAVNTSYTFQIRDAGTGIVIANATLATPRFHNVTIVLRDLVGGSPAAGVTTVNNY